MRSVVMAMAMTMVVVMIVHVVVVTVIVRVVMAIAVMVAGVVVHLAMVMRMRHRLDVMMMVVVVSAAERLGPQQPRPDDWTGLVRTPDTRLGKADDDTKREDEGGLQQQRHPGLGEEPMKKPEPPRQLDLLGLEKDDVDPVADKRVMDRVGTTGTLIRAHTIDQGRDSDTLPSF